jgi:hypothetical protein
VLDGVVGIGKQVQDKALLGWLVVFLMALMAG